MSVGGNICYLKFWLTHWGGATVLVVYNMRVTLTESSVFYCDSSMFFANIHNVLRYTCRCLPVCYLFMQSWDVPVCLLLSSISDYIVNQVTWWEYYHSNRYVIHPLRDEWSWYMNWWQWCLYLMILMMCLMICFMCMIYIWNPMYSRKWRRRVLSDSISSPISSVQYNQPIHDDK
jgi:hypothetical protein